MPPWMFESVIIVYKWHKPLFLTTDISPYAAAILSYKMPDGKVILLLITQEKQ